MLIKENRREYYVYPSWLEGQISYSWADLPRMMADPYKYDWYLRSVKVSSDECGKGYPKDIQPYELLTGVVGGGIVVAHIAENERWLPLGILHMDANLCGPAPMYWRDESGAHELYNAHFLESNGRWAIESFFETGRRPPTRTHTIGMSAENVESDPDSLYWVVSMKRSKSEFKLLPEILVWAYHFDIELHRLGEPPHAVAEETSKWQPPEFDYVWFKVNPKQHQYGYLFAVMMYIGLHLAWVSRKRVRSMHLVGAIEGKPGPYSQGDRKIF
jgi:hypothetical protein